MVDNFFLFPWRRKCKYMREEATTPAEQYDINWYYFQGNPMYRKYIVSTL